MDDGVGRILQTLDELGLAENTLVVYAADQGWMGGQNGLWGMGDHTRPLTAFDWTMSIPLILRHPGQIPAGKSTDHVVANYDLYRTLLNHLGLADKLPEQPPRPGRDLLPLVRGESINWRDEMYYEFENVRAVRTEAWKYIERFKQQPNELYDLKRDPEELNNLVDDPQLAGQRAELKAKLDAFYDRYADPQWDLWRGGKSKTGLMTVELFGKAAEKQRPQ